MPFAGDADERRDVTFGPVRPTGSRRTIIS
jgi:hypothetical protein